MTLRRSSQRTPLEAVVADLPARFYAAEVVADHGTMTGLQAYVADLTEHLRRELGVDDPPTADVMTALGIPASEWYTALLR